MTAPTPSPQETKGLKTWSALLGNKKRPSEYEIVTHGLHYRTRKAEAAYELDTNLMMNQWYRTNVFQSPLQHPDWNKFRDPDQLTYRTARKSTSTVCCVNTPSARTTGNCRPTG